MKKNIIIITLAIIIIIALIVALVIFKNSKPKENIVQTDPTSDKIEVEDLKQEMGATGNEKIYEVVDDIDGRKMLAINASIEYKVALSGMLNKTTPNIDNINKEIEKAPTGKGIWINETSKEQFMNIIKETTNGKYNIDDSGYLKTEQERKHRK